MSNLWELAIPDAEAPWRNEAACRGVDPDVFFGHEDERGNASTSRRRIERAKGICATCTVRTECLVYALENDERLGIWGGTTYVERRQIVRRRAPRGGR